MCVFVFTLIINILIAAAYQEFINNFVSYLLFVYKLYRNEENKKETKTQNHMIDFRKNFQKRNPRESENDDVIKTMNKIKTKSLCTNKHMETLWK